MAFCYSWPCAAWVRALQQALAGCSTACLCTHTWPSPTLPGPVHGRVHYARELEYRTEQALDILDESTNADNFSVIMQSIVATSVIYMILASAMFGVMLWAMNDQARIDIEGARRSPICPCATHAGARRRSAHPPCRPAVVGPAASTRRVSLRACLQAKSRTRGTGCWSSRWWACAWRGGP